MTALLGSLLYVVLCAACSAPLAARLAGADVGKAAAPLLLLVLAGSVLFYGGFFVLAAAELAFGTRWLDVEHACAVLLMVALALRAWRQPTMIGWRRHASKGLQPRALIVFAAVVAAALLLFALMQYPRGYEVTAYHLPTAVHMLQTGSIGPWDRHHPHAFPANASLYYAFWLRIVPERGASATNFVFLALAVAAVARLSLQLNVDRRAAAFAACGLVTLPMFAFAAGELSGDVGGAAFLALAVIFALDRSLPRRWLLSGLAVGLAYGFKALHLVPMALLFGVALASGWTAELEPARSSRARSALRAALLFGGGALAACGIWLLRNQLVFGSPLYPVNVPVISTVLNWPVDPAVDFSKRQATQLEFVDEPWQWLGYPWFEWQRIGQHFKHSAGLGMFFTAAAPVAWAAAIAAGLRHGLAKTAAVQMHALTAAFIVAVWWVLNDRQPRYLLGAQLLLMPLTAWLLAVQSDQRARRWLERLYALAIVLMLGVVLSREAVMFADRIVVSRQTTRSAFYEVTPLVDRLPPGTVILNLGARSWHYALAGERLHNRVLSNPHARAMLGLPATRAPIRDVVLPAEALRREGVQYVFSDGGSVSGDGCLRLEEVDRVAVNPITKVPLANPRVLYRVHDCIAPATPVRSS